MKPAKKFLILFITSFLSFMIAYSIIYNALVKKDNLINHSYKDFLLRHTNSPRLIVDSGSNSVYGINSRLLEKELGMVTINLADNGSYPFREKLYRLEKFAQQGDIIVLPIEWLHYFSTLNTPAIFLDSLFSELNFYYHEMPWIIKLNLITETPFSSLMRSAIKTITQPVLVENDYVTLHEYTERFKQGDRGDYTKIIIAGKNNEILDCNDYIFSQYLSSEAIFNGKRYVLSAEFKKNGFVISEAFKKNIQLLKKLQQRGIYILFTWPVVVGENCYQDEYALLFSALVADIKQYLTQNEMLIVGEPQQSQFASSYFFNSYYHIIPIARDKRTQQLIAEIKKSPANKWFKKSVQKSSSLRLNKDLEKRKFIALLSPINVGEEIKVNALNTMLKKTVFMVLGWHPIENWGVWSKNNASILYLKLAPNLLQQDLKLVIENEMFQSKDQTRVFINDKKLGDYLLEGKKSLIIPKQFLANNEGLIKIQFNHFNVKSPLEYGLNPDDRKIKFGLKSLQFLRVKN